MSDVPTEGETRTYTRTFTERDVEQFADLSNDRGTHHEERDEAGRLVVHGLLTATLPTKVGGDLNVLARSMTFEFRRPVYTGEKIECVVTLDSVDPGEKRIEVGASMTCHNESDELVLTGEFDGVIFR
ncbi:hotdog family protein [Halogranum rubrum]|uniref:MaoC domain-containing protein dehydratase n=1 Tax=Halogranum salarium B-1 TaxID=1210908 RepID=J3EW92_9EURY|nr:dehydratase [Halogranum salarium]EJN59097.1 MaoC domain-containing protein dehydratase [Halogranum salarium B-1]